MSGPSATRSELLAQRTQVGLAEQGRDLLQDKRTALVREFQRLGSSVLDAVRELDRRAAVANAALADAAAFDGPEAVRSAGYAAAGEIELDVRARSVAGVSIVELTAPRVSRGPLARGSALVTTSPRIDAAAEAFEAELDALLEVAARELTLRRLAAEISRTTRQVNALEHVVVPRLRAERAAIALVLAERELEERARLQRARSRGGPAR